MDPTEYQNVNHSGEMRELLTSTGSSCPPTVISSLRQLQTVTEGGFAGKKRCRTCFPPQRVVSSLCENMGYNSKNGNAGTDTDSSTWDTSAAARKNQPILPCAVLRKTQNLDVTERYNLIVKDGTRERSRRSFLVLANEVEEEMFDNSTQNAVRRRRIDGGFRKIVLDNETEKEERKCFSVDEAPTRAPSQKSIAEKEAPSSTKCAVKNLHVVPRTSGHVLQTGEELTPDVTRAEKVSAVEGADGRNTHGKMRMPTTPSRRADEGAGRRREVFCSTSSAGARYPEIVEAIDRMAQEDNQAITNHALLGRESGSSGNDSAGPNNDRNSPGTEGNISPDNIRRPDQLMKQESHRSKKAQQISLTDCVRRTRNVLEGEALNYPTRKAKARQRPTSSPGETTRDERSPKEQACSDDGLPGVETSNRTEKTNVALPHPESQSQRYGDASKIEQGAVVLGVECQSLPLVPLFGNKALENHFSSSLPREREIFSPDGEFDAAEGCYEKNWPREQDTFVESRLISSGDAFSKRERGKEKDRAEGSQQANERVEKDQETDVNKISTRLNETAIKRERSLTIASCEGKERPEEAGPKASTVVALFPHNREDDATPLLAVDSRTAHVTGGNSLVSPLQDFSRSGLIAQTPASVSLYYHVQEASPGPRKRFPTLNSRETAQHASRLYPVVKGVSRDNAKRRWAVYWKGSRRYFYDKLNENCYHAYLQAVNFRKYNYIQHASPSKSLALAKISPSNVKDRASLRQFANGNFDMTTAVKAGPTYSHHTGTGGLAESVHLDTDVPCESKARGRRSPQLSLAFTKDTPVLAPSSHHTERDAKIVGREQSDPQQKGRYHFATKESLSSLEDGEKAWSPPRRSLSRGEHSVDPVLDMYKTALLMVLEDLKESLKGLSASSALSKCSSSMKYSPESSNDCEEDEQTTSCAPPSHHLGNIPSNSPIPGSAQHTNPDIRLRPFLLLVVEWHLDNVKLASQRRELQPLLGVFSSCFQHLLLPRQAPRPLQQTIYRELMKLHNAQALSHLTNA